jgi:dsDNA-specific endonuclease/ATPase MutS2
MSNVDELNRNLALVVKRYNKVLAVLETTIDELIVMGAELRQLMIEVGKSSKPEKDATLS